MFVVMVSSALFLHAQNRMARAGEGFDYRTAIGVRGGWTSGLTVKHFFNSSTAVEGILSGYPFGASITGLVEKHKPIAGANGLRWYYGAGAHLRFHPWYYNRVYYKYGNKWYHDHVYAYGGGAGFGIDGVLGLEYKIPDIPLAFSLDFKPFFETGSGGYFVFVPDAGLGVKVAF